MAASLKPVRSDVGRTVAGADCPSTTGYEQSIDDTTGKASFGRTTGAGDKWGDLC